MYIATIKTECSYNAGALRLHAAVGCTATLNVCSHAPTAITTARRTQQPTNTVITHTSYSVTHHLNCVTCTRTIYMYSLSATRNSSSWNTHYAHVWLFAAAAAAAAALLLLLSLQLCLLTLSHAYHNSSTCDTEPLAIRTSNTSLAHAQEALA
jgi:hypothetical protein